MPRLVAFGCSLTYGDGLPDCYVPDGDDPLGYHAGPLPSESAWPSLAAGMLGMDCLNLARSGNSNTRMLMDIIDHRWQPGDVAAMLWTYTDRDVLYTDSGPRNVGPWNATSWDLAGSYYTAHGRADLQMRTWMAHHHAASYLASIGVPFAMGSAEPWDRHWWSGEDHRTINHSHFSPPFIDVSPDGWHGGEMQHAAWARLFASRLGGDTA